jgi:hypothetical protein
MGQFADQERSDAAGVGAARASPLATGRGGAVVLALQQTAGNCAVCGLIARGAAGLIAPGLSRKDDDDPDPEPPKPKAGGKTDPVVEIRVDPATKRTAFVTSSGQLIEGTVDMDDLAAGPYELTPNVKARQWAITGAPSGLRFFVTLDGALPWQLSYPRKLRLLMLPKAMSEKDAYGALDKELERQIDAIERGIDNVPMRYTVKTAIDHMRNVSIPGLRTMLAAARKDATAAQGATGSEVVEAANAKAGASYQATLIAIHVMHLQANLLIVCGYADQAGVPTGVILDNLDQFQKHMLPLMSALNSLDVEKMRTAFDKARPDFQATEAALDKAITDIGVGEKLSRKVIAVADLIMLAFSAYQVYKMPTIAGGGGPGPPPAFGRVYAGGVATGVSSLSAAQLAEMIEAVRKLIAIGALDPAIIGGISAVAGSQAAPIAELGKPQAMEMSSTGSSPSSGKLVPGKSDLGEYGMDEYGTFANRPGDKFAGHEMLQNSWLKLKGFTAKRGVGVWSRKNPAVALPKAMHDEVGRQQRLLGLFDQAKVAQMTAEENIGRNAEAMQKAGVPDYVIETLRKEALRHAASLPQLAPTLP